VYAALQESQGDVTFDEEPVAGSRNTVRSGGLYTVLQGKQNDLTGVPVVGSLLETDYLFLERGRRIYKIRASAVIIPSGDGESIETESGDSLLTEGGDEILLDTGDEERNAALTESGEQMLTESNEVITIN
jgi:hypothetical protein